MIDNSKEYIICSAIHYDNHIHYSHMDGYGINSGFVIGGYRHHNIKSILPTNILYKDNNEKSKWLNVTWNSNIVDSVYNSVDIAMLIAHEIYVKYNTFATKKRLNLLVYIAYGIYAALTNKHLTDEGPVIGVYGPTFNSILKSNKLDNVSYEKVHIEYESNIALKEIIEFIVDKYSNTSVFELSKWAHNDDGPWSKTIKLSYTYINWNDTIINFELIKEYFSEKFIESYNQLHSKPIAIQGFITNKGRFVNREEAAVIAYNCGQIQKPINKLFSEDLY